MREMTITRKLVPALLADLEQIEDNVALFTSGRISAYQTVAIQLRNLLCGARNLTDRVLPNTLFHQLRESVLPPEFELDEGTTAFQFESRGGLVLGGPTPVLHLDFEGEPVLTRAEFLSQWVVRRDITIGTLIDRTANEEVAHTDDAIGSSIARVNALRFGGRYQGFGMHHLTIVAAGGYIAHRLRQELHRVPTP